MSKIEQARELLIAAYEEQIDYQLEPLVALSACKPIANQYAALLDVVEAAERLVCGRLTDPDHLEAVYRAIDKWEEVA
jgi:hypothetical protein